MSSSDAAGRNCMLKLCAKDPAEDSTILLEKLIATTTKVYNSAGFSEGKKNLASYCVTRTSETKGYPYLGKCFNNAFELLRNEEIPKLRDLSEYSDLVAHVNHPELIHHKYHYSESDLSPSLCLVTKRLLDSKIAGNPTSPVNLQWSDIFSSVEVRHMGKAGFSNPHKEYTTPHAKHVKEYHVFPDNELPEAQRCASTRFVAAEPGSEDALTMKYDSDWYDDEIEDQVESDPSSTSSQYSETSDTEEQSLESPSSSNSGQSDNDNRISRKRKTETSPETSLQHESKRQNIQSDNLIPNEQVSLYGCEMLCRRIYSLHAINLLIVDDIVWVWWHDRENVIQTSGLNFVEDMPYFMVLLAVFQRFNLVDWGVEPSLAPSSMFVESGPPPNPVEIKFDNGVVATIHPPSDELPIRRPVLKGRATCIISAASKSKLPNSSESLDGQNLIIKACWPETRRMSEVAIIEQAVDALENSEDKHLVKRLPKLFGSKDIASSVTSNITDLLGKLAPGTYPRILRLMLFRRLEPLKEIDDDSEEKCLKTWMQCLACHHALWKKGIYHSDISVYNLMWDTVDDCAVLNDFDLSEIKGCELFGDRAANYPFMARHILYKSFIEGTEERKYVHEVESFVWVLAWLCLKDTLLPPSMDWRNGDLQSISYAKYCFKGQKLKTLKSRYLFAWGKCQLLLKFLNYVYELESNYQMIDLPGRPDPHEIYSEVIKIMETDYTFEDNIKFYDKMMREFKMAIEKD
ncbi:hypothetical protein BDQ17DRAFT_1331082 [Cyathus striatus]|nr:hypothetical protein BDQ17DRAFT_1331082 [Cyathus striatus]